MPGNLGVNPLGAEVEPLEPLKYLLHADDEDGSSSINIKILLSTGV